MDAVPKLKVAVGSTVGELPVDDDGDGPGVPVHPANPKASTAAPNCMLRRRILLLATRVPSSRLEVLWPASARPHSSLVERPECAFQHTSRSPPAA
ncbi:hypothetical protein ARTHRO9V_100293 [Arthrobacter sp. 9V]|nr:hypothetical protein ARTHRO9V_100293 [Arthrobacter sp. 9V]